MGRTEITCATALRVIHREVARVTEIEPATRRRLRAVVYARWLAMMLSRELTGASTPWIAREYGCLDHTSVLYAVARYRDVETPEMARTAEAIRAMFHATYRVVGSPPYTATRTVHAAH